MTFHLPSPRRALPGALSALAALLLVMLAPGPGAGATVTLQPGETLSAIAARSGVSVGALAAANGIGDPDRVVAGTRLTLPGGGGGGGAAAGTGGHVVRPGETLSAIAARHGVSVSALAGANGIRDHHMVVAGRRLRIPGGVAAGSGGGAVVSSGGGHVVRPGETLDAIAARYGTTAAALAAANGVGDPNRIRAGQRIRVLGAPATGGAGAGAYVGPRTVARGDVRALIDAAAARYGVDPALARAIAHQESGFNQNVRSHVGATGVMQLMPATAAWVGPSLVGRTLNPADVRDNVDGGVAYLGWLMRQTGDGRRAAAAYYQGLNALRSRGMFDDTRAYVRAVYALHGRV